MISPFLVLAIGTCLTTSLVPGKIGGHRQRDGETHRGRDPQVEHRCSR